MEKRCHCAVAAWLAFGLVTGAAHGAPEDTGPTPMPAPAALAALPEAGSPASPAPGQASCAVVSLTPPAPVVAPGAPVELAVVADFTCTPTIGGGFDLLWDPAFFDFVDWQMLAPPGALISDAGTVDTQGGLVNSAGFLMALFPPETFSGPAQIGRLTLRPAQPGSSTVTVSADGATAPETFGPWLGAAPAFEELFVTYAGAQVSVAAPVPVPPWALVAVALLCASCAGVARPRSSAGAVAAAAMLLVGAVVATPPALAQAPQRGIAQDAASRKGQDLRPAGSLAGLFGASSGGAVDRAIDLQAVRRLFFALAECGNGFLDAGEECDDGNFGNGDGCSTFCEIEDGFSCEAPVPPSPWEAVDDGSFEAPDGPWQYASDRFASPRCSLATCGYSFGAGAAEGEWWLWLGGVGGDTIERASASQTLVIPQGATELRFRVEAIRCDSAQDRMRVTIDGQSVYELTGTDPICGNSGYSTRSVDISAFADGAAHTLTFEATTTGFNSHATSIFIDDVSIPWGLGEVIPSRCARLPRECLAATFDGLGGDLAAIGWSTFSTGATPLTWTTTDAAGCGGGNWGGGNVTGGGGDAACADADAVGTDTSVESWLCSPPMDLSFARPPVDLTLRVNAHGVPPRVSELVGVYAGTSAPTPASVSGYTRLVASNENQGLFARRPGASLTGDLASFTGSPQVWMCLRFAGEGAWYAQIDDVDARAVGCRAGVNDFDGDGVVDAADNCITRDNGPLQPDAGGNVQVDADGDGFGNVCDPDFNGDCIVAQSDLEALLAGFLSTDPVLDLDGDGVVNLRDLAMLLRQGGLPPGPSGVASCTTGSSVAGNGSVKR